MKELIDYIRKMSFEDFSEFSFSADKVDNSFNKFIELSNPLKESNSTLQSAKLVNLPKPSINNIWLCKSEYIDSLGNTIKGQFPYLVRVVSEIEELEEDSFVRVQPISPFIELKSADDFIVSDASIIGFEFLVETWNEQPILIDILDKYLGSIPQGSKKYSNDLTLTPEHQAFREIEIERTAYLRQSVLSCLELQAMELDQLIFLNFDNEIILPRNPDDSATVVNLYSSSEQNYLQAAKKGKLKSRPTYYFEKTVKGIELKIIIIKEEEKYIVSVKQPENIVLTDINGMVLKQTTANLYDELISGLYFIKINGHKNEIRIRLK